MDIFDNIDTAQANIKLQQISDQQNIIVKKAGRPRRPNMLKKTVKIDQGIYARIRRVAQKQDTTIASLISKGLRLVLDELEE